MSGGNWFEIQVVTTQVFTVEMNEGETLEQAFNVVAGEVGNFDEMDGVQLFSEEQIERSKRFADTVLDL